jgi:hypothetical protein
MLTDRPPLRRAFRTLTGVVVVAAVVAQLTAELVPVGSGFTRVVQAVRPATTLYEAVALVVYTVRLGPDPAGMELLGWVDGTLHLVAPVLLVADWFLVPSTRTPGRGDIPWWLVYPVVFVTYSLVRGHRVGWYPYDFLDPRDRGYVSVVVGTVVAGAFITVAAGGLVALTRALNEVRGARPAQAPPLS